jgi:type IX secretion system PorP/SprF family membrane protein
MKRFLLAILFFVSLTAELSAQDIPLFTQKLTNSFLYNPALAGNGVGSLTASYRNNYSNVDDGPKNYFLSMHTPFSNYRFGAGANIYQDVVSIWKNTYYSAAFAYHLKLNNMATLSFGVGGEYNTFQLNGVNTNSEAYIVNDAQVQRYLTTSGKPDFSFGMMYQSQYFKVGVSANRLATSWSKPQGDNLKVLSNYYTGFVQGTLPLRGGDDLLEPYFSFRKFSETSDSYDLGLYYTYDNKITAGAATRAGNAPNNPFSFNVANFTLAYRLNQYLLVGYSREMLINPVGGFVGSSNEFTLRYDFADQNYQKKFKADYKNSLSYRRKTLSSSSVRRPAGGRTPKQLNKAQKRVAAFSPNKRYQNTKKLSMGKKAPLKKPKYKASTSKRRPVYNQKRRRK